MSGGIRALGYGVRRAIGGAARRPLVHVLTIGAVGVALLLLGVVVLAARNVSSLTSSWGGGIQMVIYLEPDTSPEHARSIARILESSGAVRGVDYVPPDEAQRRLMAALGEHRELLAGVETGYLPASLEVGLAEGVRDVAELSPLVTRLRATRGVEEVELLGDWVDRVSALLTTFRVAALALALLVGGACLYVVASTIQLGMLARKEELEILKLVGATDGFVKTPLVIEGMVQGAAGAATAVGLLYGLYRWSAPGLEKVLGGALGPVKLSFLSPSEAALTVLVGMGLGLLGSWMAVSRYARI